MALADLAASIGQALLSKGDGTQAPRVPMVLSCTTWRSRNLQPLALRINPHNVRFSQPKRITKKNTQGGTVYFHWSDANGSDNDILEMQFRGRTGSILNKPNDPNPLFAPGPRSVQAQNLQNPPSQETPNPNAGATKHYFWARLYELTRLPVLDKTLNSVNQASIVYRSPFFPSPIVFYGFFNNVLDFSEVAESPFMMEWSFSFIVQNTSPKLDTLTQYIQNALLTPINQSIQSNNAVQTTNQQAQANANALKANTKNG